MSKGQSSIWPLLLVGETNEKYAARMAALKADPVQHAIWKERERIRMRKRRGIPLDQPVRLRGPVPMTEVEKKAKRDAYNHRPDVAAKRKKFYKDKRANDPAWKADAKAKAAIYYLKNKKRIDAYNRGYGQRNKGKLRSYYAGWHRDRRRTDPQYNVRNRLCSRIWHALANGAKKAAKTEELVGCTVASLRLHLESGFTDGMTWQKFLLGEIHIDHIIPCSRFDLSKPSEQFKCFHWSNLQPLWAIDNLMKSDKILVEQTAAMC